MQRLRVSKPYRGHIFLVVFFLLARFFIMCDLAQAQSFDVLLQDLVAAAAQNQLGSVGDVKVCGNQGPTVVLAGASGFHRLMGQATRGGSSKITVLGFAGARLHDLKEPVTTWMTELARQGGSIEFVDTTANESVAATVAAVLEFIGAQALREIMATAIEQAAATHVFAGLSRYGAIVYIHGKPEEEDSVVEKIEFVCHLEP